MPEPGIVPPTAGAGVRWIATSTAALVVATIGVLVDAEATVGGAILVGLGAVAALAALTLERRGRRGPVSTTLLVVGAVVALLGVEALVRPDTSTLDLFLGASGAAFVALGLWHDDRRPVALGVLQWATALGRPAGDVYRHCLVATDVQIPLPVVEPLAALGLALLVAALAMRHGAWRVEAARGFENVGLALLLGGLAAKALELPGHRLLCGSGDAVDTGWALLFLGVALGVGGLGALWSDRLWASAGLAAATLFGLAATVLEDHAWWSLLVGVPLLTLLLVLDRHGTAWPARDQAPLRSFRTRTNLPSRTFDEALPPDAPEPR